MYKPTVIFGVALATLSGVAHATLNITNWCETPVYVYQSHNGECDKGPNEDVCYYEAGGEPYFVQSGTSLPLAWKDSPSGTSVKMSTSPDVLEGILQFEYALPADGLYWDLSDLDGRGAAQVGSPFREHNVKVTPETPALGEGTCLEILCPAGIVCDGSYQNPDDVSTRFCPREDADFSVDLCIPDELFAQI